MGDCRMSNYEVTVTFPAGFPSEAQGRALLAFEQYLRNLTGLEVHVFKAKMGDDSKLRMAMTAEERNLV